MPADPVIPLEDELGDVLDKALRCSGFNEEHLAECAGVSVEKIRNAEDYRYDDLTDDELRRLAAALRLNEVGLVALPVGPLISRPLNFPPTMRIVYLTLTPLIA